jgi:hypothetical protein
MTQMSKVELGDALLETVKKRLRDWTGSKDLKVTPNDRLYEKYGIVDEDLDELVIDVARSHNLELPGSTDYWKEPVLTVADLINFVSTFKARC